MLYTHASRLGNSNDNKLRPVAEGREGAFVTSQSVQALERAVLLRLDDTICEVHSLKISKSKNPLLALHFATRIAPRQRIFLAGWAKGPWQELQGRLRETDPERVFQQPTHLMQETLGKPKQARISVAHRCGLEAPGRETGWTALCGLSYGR